MSQSFAVRSAIEKIIEAMRTFSCDSEDGYFVHLHGKNDSYVAKFTVQEFVAIRRLMENQLTRLSDAQDRYALVQQLKRTSFVQNFLDPDVGYLWPTSTPIEDAVAAERELDTFRLWFEAVAHKCSSDVTPHADRDKEATLRNIQFEHKADGPWSPTTLLEQKN